MNTTTCSAATGARRTKRPTVLRLVKLALKARKQRRDLRHLDKTTLNDLGLSQEQAKQEADRPIWDVPGNWLR